MHSLLNQGRGVHDHGVLATGFCHQHHGLAISAQAFSGLLVQQSGHVGGAGKQHARYPRIGHQRRAHGFAPTGQQLQHIGVNIMVHACLMQQAHGFDGDQRGLLGRFGQHHIACGQRGGYLAGEDGQRKIPGADADHRTYAGCE